MATSAQSQFPPSCQTQPEDKIVQGAVAEVLNAVYEADFMGFSYGFRPERSPHAALAALDKALMTQRVDWVLDVDIRTFFDYASCYPPQEPSSVPTAI